MEVLVETIGIPASIVLFILLTLAYAYLQNSAKERGDAEKNPTNDKSNLGCFGDLCPHRLARGSCIP